jgi:hypothetical protein
LKPNAKFCTPLCLKAFCKLWMKLTPESGSTSPGQLNVLQALVEVDADSHVLHSVRDPAEVDAEDPAPQAAGNGRQ